MPKEKTMPTSCAQAIQDHWPALAAKNTVPLLFRVCLSVIYRFEVSSQSI